MIGQIFKILAADELRHAACYAKYMRKAAAKGTKSGNPIGRPRVDAETESAIERLLRGGTGINKTAATVGVGTATVQRVRAEMGPFESEAAA